MQIFLKKLISKTFLLLLFFSCVARLIALEVNLKVTEDAGQPRKGELVTAGVPLPRGLIKNLGNLTIKSGGRLIPAQFSQIAPWDDGSIRWALLNTQIDIAANGTTTLQLNDTCKNPAPAQPVKINEAANGVTMSTAGFSVFIPRHETGLLRAKLNGREVCSNNGRGIVLHTVGEEREIETKKGWETIKKIEYGVGQQIVASPPDSIKIEEAGPVRAIVAVKGKFPDVHKGLLSYTARITLCAGEQQVKVRLWIENNGAMGYYYEGNPKRGKEEYRVAEMEWFLFDGLELELGMGLKEPVATCEGTAAVNGKLKVFQTQRWNKDDSKLTYNDYEVFLPEDFEYVITAGSEEIKRGLRSDGIMEIKAADGNITAAIRNFWQNYDKAIEQDGQLLRLWFWPTEGQWPRERKLAWSVYPELAKLPKPGLYYLPGGVHKSHDFVLDFSDRSVTASVAGLTNPLYAFADATYYADSEAIPTLFSPPGIYSGDTECDSKLAAWEKMYDTAIDPKNPFSLIAGRDQAQWSSVGYFGDTTYWYGWMDFGDLPMPGHGPTSQQNDWLWIMLMGAIRTGNPGFMRMADDMGGHRIDIDQLWSDRDMPELNGLQRGPNNFPGFHCYRLYYVPIVSYNHLEGMVLYYLMTGDTKALEACMRNAEGMRRAWKNVLEKQPWAGPQTDMAANGWSIHGYCSMNALTGKQEWLDEALTLFRTNVVAKWRSLGPHLHSRDQIASQSYMKDDIKYCHAIANFCLLHKLTGDPDILKLLEEGSEQPFPENYYDAPLYLAGLHAYIAIASKKPELLEQAVEDWITASPEDKEIPVFLPGNSVWADIKSMHMRSGHLLQYGLWKSRKTKD